MKRLYVAIIILLPLFTLSCSVAGKLKKADEAYESGAYFQAGKLYRKIASKVDKDKRGEVYFRLAESQRHTGNTSLAAVNYEYAIRNKFPDPIAYLYDVQMLMTKDELKKDDITKIEKQITAFRQLAPSDPRGQMLEDSYKLITAPGNKVASKYKVENMSVFNTRFQDYAPAYASSDYETIYFTSSRPEGEKKRKIYSATGQKAVDIFTSSLSKSGWTKPSSVKDAMNSQYEDGACVFDKSFTTLYFTQCRNDKGENLGCAIYTAKLNGDTWSDPEQLLLAPDSLVAAHPTLSSDGLTLYFVSNMPGGLGGLDIWKTTRASESDTWGEPVNVGIPINTRGDEMFPSMRGDTVLYFSSTGHPGFGGLDIFKSHINPTDGSFGEVINAGKPFNSNADDFAIIFEDENDAGYFTSRRKGGKGGDDIYSFRFDIPAIEYWVKGSVRDAKTNARLANADIKITGSNGATLKKKTDNNGVYEFRLSANTDYITVATREGYFAQKSKRISTKGLKESKTFTDTLLMTSFEKPVEIPNIFFAFGKADLSDESKTSLDQLIGIMNDNPTIVVELRAHTDSRGTDEVNNDLSQRRAQSVVDYLVSHGIDEDRMQAKGFGESEPRVVTKEIAAKYPFLKVGIKLEERFIDALPNEEQKEICHALNRRTELQVISDQYSVE